MVIVFVHASNLMGDHYYFTHKGDLTDAEIQARVNLSLAPIVKHIERVEV